MTAHAAGLPDPYVVVPFELTIDADVAIPGSKSLTNRALLCAALASGTTELRGVLQADDTEAMQDCIAALGARHVYVAGDPTRVSVTGVGGSWAAGPITVNARMSGTTARFLAPSLLLGSGAYLLDGRESMRERPMGDLVAALRSAGARVEDRQGGRLPLTIIAEGALRSTGVLADRIVDPITLTIPGNVSSQFLSGLLLSAPCLPAGAVVRVEGELVSRPYVDMTIAVMRAFGAVVTEPSVGEFEVLGTGYTSPEVFAIEPDASAASYAFAAAAIVGGRVSVPSLGIGSVQGDLRFAAILAEMGARVSITETGTEVVAERGSLRGITVDMADCSDTAQTLAVVAAHAVGPTTVTGIGFIRHKETNRVSAVVAELKRCGVDAVEHEDGFTINPGKVTPATVQTYRDHRMAMSFALLGLRNEGIKIADPGCVAKTFPEFFSVMEAWRRVNSPVAKPMVIALDGPAGSGKSTVAKAVAARLGIEHLDTGAMYRSVAWAARERSVNVSDPVALAQLASSSVIRVGVDRLNRQVVSIDGIDVTSAIRQPEIDALTGPVASNPAVRAALVGQQRQWAVERGSGVMEGRDISSVVFPDAPVQVYLTADPFERARRRSAQSGFDVQEVLADLERRDHVDSTREADPLHVARGATVLDTTGLTIDQVVDRIVEMIPDDAFEVKGSGGIGPRKPVLLVSPLISPPIAPLFRPFGSSRSNSNTEVAASERVLNRREKALYGSIHFLVRGFTRWWVKVEMIGTENVPTSGAFILSANHRSVVDFLLVGPVTRRRMRYLGKDTVWDAKWFVPIANTLGGIPVARGTVDRDSMKRCIEALGGGEPLVLFPEGMRKSGPVVQELFDGVAFIAIKANAPILPVGIGGSEVVMPKGTFFPRRRHVTMIIGEPIFPPEQGISGSRSLRKTAPEMTKLLHQRIQELFDAAMAMNAKK